MKPVLFFMAMMFCGLHAFSQIQYSAELAQKLNDKTNFQEIKSTVINHYRAKLAVLSSADSVEKKGIIRQLKMWNREFWINENYTNAQGGVEPAAKVITKALDKIKQQARSTAGLSQAQSENWVQDGPISSTLNSNGEGVGRIDRIAFHPTNVTIMFAGSPYGGLFKTTDGGANWFPISEYVASLGVSGIVVNPVNPDIIYVLSGDGESHKGCFNGEYCDSLQGKISASNGVYKTTDGGSTWQKLPDFPGVTETTLYQGRQLIINPANPNTLLAATSIGLFRTTDAGNNWAAVTANDNIWDIKYKPADTTVVYCTGNNFFRRSLNGGASFTGINIPDLSPATRISLAVTSANPQRVVMLAGSKSMNACVGVFSSPDGGSTFTKYASSPVVQYNLFQNYVGDTLTSKQYDYNNTIVINPADENMILVGGLCVWATHDGGVNWEQKTKYWANQGSPFFPYIHPDQHMLAYNPLGTLFCTNDAGVYRSIDNGDSWAFIETGLSTTQFYHFELENEDGNNWGGAQDNGILERTNIGEFTVFAGGDGYDVMTDNPSRTANGNSNDKYYTVNDGIASDFTDISVPENICQSCPHDYFGNLAMSPQNEDIIYVGYQTNVYRSGDAGGTWINWDNIPGNWSIAAGTNHENRIYSSGINNANPGKRIWKDAYPATWNDLTPGLVNAGYKIWLKISDIEPNKLDDDKVFISVAGVFAGCKVFSTLDAGTTWTNITYNLPNVPAFCIKEDELGGLYVGTSIGVYYKESNKNYWVPFYNGLPAVPVTQIELSANRVHISTFGRGLWSTAKVTNCTNNLTLTGSVVGRNYYEVSNNINSNQTILNSPGTNIIYSAGNKITFTPGTHIKKGAKFRGKAQPCGGQVEF